MNNEASKIKRRNFKTNYVEDKKKKRQKKRKKIKLNVSDHEVADVDLPSSADVSPVSDDKKLSHSNFENNEKEKLQGNISEIRNLTGFDKSRNIEKSDSAETNIQDLKLFNKVTEAVLPILKEYTPRIEESTKVVYEGNALTKDLFVDRKAMKAASVWCQKVKDAIKKEDQLTDDFYEKELSTIKGLNLSKSDEEIVLKSINKSRTRSKDILEKRHNLFDQISDTSLEIIKVANKNFGNNFLKDNAVVFVDDNDLEKYNELILKLGQIEKKLNEVDILAIQEQQELADKLTEIAK